jgi:hypothetical protein
MTPKTPRRWLQSAISEAKKTEVEMPWTRDSARATTQRLRALSPDPQHPKAAARRA